MQTILIIDSYQDIRELLKIYLENKGYMTLQCDSAVEGISICKKNKIDLLIMDMGRPGTEEFKYLKSFHIIFPDLKQILMTGGWRGKPDEKGKLIISKPFSLKSLDKSIKRVMSG